MYQKRQQPSLASSFFKTKKKMTLNLGMYIHITMRKRVSTKLHSKLLLYGTILLLFMHNVDKQSQKCENLISTPRKMHSALCSFEHTPNPAEACPLSRQLVPLKHSNSYEQAAIATNKGISMRYINTSANTYTQMSAGQCLTSSHDMIVLESEYRNKSVFDL